MASEPIFDLDSESDPKSSGDSNPTPYTTQKCSDISPALRMDKRTKELRYLTPSQGQITRASRFDLDSGSNKKNVRISDRDHVLLVYIL